MNDFCKSMFWISQPVFFLPAVFGPEQWLLAWIGITLTWGIGAIMHEHEAK